MLNYRPTLLYALLAFLLNFFWESWHGFALYAGINGLTPGAYVRLITYASTVDMLVLTAMFIGGAAIWQSEEWYERMDIKKYAYLIGVTVTVAVWIEYRALYLLDKWSYNETMPTVFSLGLSPLVQLAITGCIGLALLRVSRPHQRSTAARP